MMYSKVAMMALIGSAEALNAAPVLRGSALATPRMAPLRMDEAAAPAKKETEAEPAPPPAPPPAPEYSQALPFLTRRASLGPKGALVGDVGFDPLGFTEVLPLEWLREAEIKHCRVAMMAVVGFIFTDFYTLPGYEFTTLEAHDAGVANGSMSQLLLWIGLLEVVSTISIDQMLRGSGREPGDYGFDPIGMISDPKKKANMQMKEIANGRLAMFAFGGMVTQSVLTGNSFPYLFGDATTFGSGGDFSWNVVAGFGGAAAGY